VAALTLVTQLISSLRLPAQVSVVIDGTEYKFANWDEAAAFGAAYHRRDFTNWDDEAGAYANAYPRQASFRLRLPTWLMVLGLYLFPACLIRLILVLLLLSLVRKSIPGLTEKIALYLE